MWIGTAMGLYLLNRDSGKYEYIKLEAGSTYINTALFKQITDAICWYEWSGSIYI